MVYIQSRFAEHDAATLENVEQWLGHMGFNSDTDEGRLIRQAFLVANDAHGQQTRASGEPYITHALAVAEILVELHLDPEAIMAAILHDVVEDTQVKLEDIQSMFGDSVMHLVDGVTKLRYIEKQGLSERGRSKESLQAESLRKLLLAMAEDVRVVLIKLADRLHNMRTLKHLPEYKQKRVAKETLDIYAPLANRLGIWQIKWELEDLAFRFLETERYQSIAKSLDGKRSHRERYIQNAIDSIKTELGKAGINAEVNGRPKHIYSIYKKMKRKGVGIHDLFDVRAVRVLVDKLPDCYAALGVIHTLWRHIPKEFDDYIATPKENMYQSIHTAVLGPEGKTLEVQIRTREMHEHAELGIAAHWTYKEGNKKDAQFEQKIAWLRQLLEWKDETDDAGDFIDRFKSEVFQDRVYVLTPQGDIIDLQQGATPLDFAYHIHTDVGHRCRGARVNGRIVSLTHELKSGEQVEILTTRIGQPSRDWLNPQLGYLRTSRARAKARQWFKALDHDQNVALGREVLDKELRRLGLQGLSHKKLAEKCNYTLVDDFYASVGRGDISSVQIASQGHNLLQTDESKTPAILTKSTATQTAGEFSIEGVGNLLTRLARCCSPAPGDDIVGFITQGRGVTVHRRDCSNILKMNPESHGRLINVDWMGSASEKYPVNIQIEAYDRQNLLRDVLNVFSNEKINVISTNTHTNSKLHTAYMELAIEINSVGQLSKVLNRLGQLNNVLEVRRYNKN